MFPTVMLFCVFHKHLFLHTVNYKRKQTGILLFPFSFADKEFVRIKEILLLFLSQAIDAGDKIARKKTGKKKKSVVI